MVHWGNECPNYYSEQNYIGVAADGVTPINNSAVGIQVSAANGTTILDNTIVNNTNGGVSINNINNVKLQGNYIGTTAAGTVMRNGKYGVWIGGTSSGTLVGGTGVGQKNVISGHNLVTSDIGVQITGTTTNTTVQGNYIGVGPDGVTRMPNGNGIGVQGSSTNVTIGGSSSAARNIVSGNQNNGIIINGATTGSSGIAVQGNYIGLDKNGNAVTGATGYGITFTSPNGVLIGGAAAGEGNVISGNPAIGLYFAGNNFGQNVNIYGNTIGLKPDNETTAPNGTGISTGAMSTPLGSIQIGGASAGQGNIISGNTANGITLANFQSSAFPMSIKGNRIGQSISGVAKPNGTGIGFYNTTRGVLVGGVGPGEGNIIANNTGVGVSIASSPTISNITVRGNSIYLNGSLGIDLSGNNGSPDVWDITDADTGSNGLQNFARRTTFTKCNGTTTETRTVIRSTANTTFDVDFYANPSGRDVSGYGEGEQYISSTTVTTDSNGYVALTPPAATNLSMTATDPSGNTSEFSNERTASVGSCTVTNKTTNDTTPSLAGTLSATNTTPTLKVTVDGQTVNATVSGTSWTLADNTLSALADGTYDVTTTYTDPETTMTTSYTKVGALTVDSTVPTASITRKSGQASYTQTNSAWFTLTLSEAAATGTLTAADIAPGTTTGTVTTFTKIDDTHYEFEITGMTSGNTATPSIAAGKFTDVNGNANTTSTGDANNWVLYDTTAPNLFAVNVDITGSYSLNSPRITWSTTDDQSGIDHYTISYDGGSFSTVTSPQTPTLAAASSHTVTVRAYDKAGNVREKTIQYPPVVVITAPTTLSKNAITDTSIEVQGPVGMVINTVTISGAGSSGFTCDTLPGTVTIRCTGGQIMSTGTLTVTATSDGGVTTDNSQAYVIDTVNPSVTINQKSGQADPTNVNSATYRVVFSENINPATFTASDLSVAGTSGAITSFTKIDDRTWEVEITGMTSGDTAQLTLAASKVQDPAGNDNTVSTSTDNSVTYDNVKPTITINKKSGQADPTNVNSATFTVISSEALTSLDASDFTTSNTTGSVTTVTAINATTWEVTITGMTSGDNATLTMTAGATTDLAGNDNIASTSTDNFVAYDSVAPTIGVTAQATNNTSPQIKGTVNDSTATIMVTVNGQDYPATNNGDGTWMLASGAISPALGEATYDVVAKATDAAGNNGTDATLDELVIDTTSPTGTIDTLDPGISNAPQLTGTVNDPSATILVTANGNTYTAANHGDGTWMLAAGAISPALVPGDYTATVVFKDAATNTSNVQTTITVLRGDADVPTVSSVNWIGGTPKITGTYDQANSQSLRVRVNGLWYRLGTDPQLTVNGNAWTLDLTNIQPPLAAGSYDVTVEITTRSGATIADTSTAELKVLAPNPANIIGNLLAPHSGVTLLKTAIPLLLIPVVIISAITTLYVSRRIYLYYR